MSEGISKNYVSSAGVLFDNIGSSLELFDRLLLGLRSLSNGMHFITLLFNERLSDLKSTVYGKITSGIDKGRGVISAARFIVSVEWILSRKILWERDRITGEFLEDDSGKRVLRNWTDIACDICLAIGRFLSPILWLERIKAIDLGKHAEWLGNLTIAAFSIVSTLCFVRSVEEFINEATVLNLIEILSNTFDFLECLVSTLSFESQPGLALAAAIICSISAGLYITKELIKVFQKQ